MENKGIILLGIIALITGFIGWYVFDYFVGMKDNDSTITSEQVTNLEEKKSVNVEPTRKDIPPYERPEVVPTRSNLLSINGEIKQIGNDFLTVEEKVFDEIQVWSVEIDDRTEIIKHTDRPADEVRKAKAAGERIRPYVKEKVEFSAFEIGQKVTISSWEDIANKKAFTAKEIIIRVSS